MIEASDLQQPQSIEDMVLENNAMLQVIIHNQAYLVQFMSDIYTELHFARTGELPKESDAIYVERSKMANDKLQFYKETVAKVYIDNLKKVKINAG